MVKLGVQVWTLEQEEACLLGACKGKALGLALLARLRMTDGASVPCLLLLLAWAELRLATSLLFIRLRRSSRYVKSML